MCASATERGPQHISQRYGSENIASPHTFDKLLEGWDSVSDESSEFQWSQGGQEHVPTRAAGSYSGEAGTRKESEHHAEPVQVEGSILEIVSVKSYKVWS